MLHEPGGRPRLKSHDAATPKPNQRQGQVLACIYWYSKVNRRPPSEADIAAYFSVAPPSARQMILRLESLGFLSRTPGAARSLQVRLAASEIPFLEDPRRGWSRRLPWGKVAPCHGGSMSNIYADMQSRSPLHCTPRLITLSRIDGLLTFCFNLSMDYEEYKKLRKQIMDEYEAELAALDKVWKRFQSLNSPSSKTHAISNGMGAHGVSIARSIRAAIKDFKQDFTADDVQQSLIDHSFIKQEEINRLAITNSLHRLYRRGEIEVVTKGSGRSGSIYRLKQPKETQ